MYKYIKKRTYTKYIIITKGLGDICINIRFGSVGLIAVWSLSFDEENGYCIRNLDYDIMKMLVKCQERVEGVEQQTMETSSEANSWEHAKLELLLVSLKPLSVR